MIADFADIQRPIRPDLHAERIADIRSSAPSPLSPLFSGLPVPAIVSIVAAREVEQNKAEAARMQ